MPESFPIIDKALLDDITDGNTELQIEVMRVFLANAPSYLSALRIARDATVWRDQAHKLKGAARSVGAMALAHSAALAEENPPIGHADRTAALSELEEGLKALEDAMARLSL